MDSLTPNVSPLRQRMIEDMRMRKMGGKTQIAYIRAVRRLAAFLKRSPDTATADELRRFQLHMVDTGTSPSTINGALSGLKFFFDVTLGRAELLVKMQPVPQPLWLPVVLTCEEVARLIAAAPNLKSRAALSDPVGRDLSPLPPNEIAPPLLQLLAEHAASGMPSVINFEAGFAGEWRPDRRREPVELSPPTREMQKAV